LSSASWARLETEVKKGHPHGADLGQAAGAAPASPDAPSRDKLIFPDADGQPLGSGLLRLLKIRAYEAGLNCGQCTGRGKDEKGNPVDICCADGPVCTKWKSHRFRAMFATEVYERGADNITRSLMDWLGHTGSEASPHVQNWTAVAPRPL
jgi:hypothetical protein